jgi:serine/threonine protein kinase/tetratricopeptide (TPR) repeat protein
MALETPIVGQVLGHYRVLEQIGAGGMGLVFRASDEQLERDVAIKVLPSGMLADDAARKRFRREALTLAKLNHPNIGTVYEFGSQEGLDFLVMEYVGGIPVDARLGSGPLSQKEVLRLGFQLADGLSSAHDHGVIHRDLKPANLRWTQDSRLKILDFGLAQFVRQEVDMGVTASFSEGKQVAGTLPYMPPEQLRGEVVDQRSDIWSAGAVLYELATGRRPFASSQVPLLIDAILNKPPEAPSAVNPQISPGLEMAILKCLDKDPERRYQSARELRVDLDRLTMPISHVPSTPNPVSTSVATPAKTRIRPVTVVLGAIALLLVGAVWYLRFHSQPARENTTQLSQNRRRTVAVLNFKNSTSRPEAAWLSTALPEMLTTELAAGERVRTITGEDVAQMKVNLSLPDADTLTAQTLSQIGKTLGADFVVLGSYVALPGGKLRVDLHLQDVAAGETVLSVDQTGDEDNLFDLVSRAGIQLREKCGAGEVSPQDQAGVRAAFPATPEASKLYAEGLAKLRVFDATVARDLLQQAVAAEPNHALAHSALAAAWTLLGYDEKARLSAKSAYELSTSLSREDRLLIEARYREASKEWDNAAQSYRTLFGFFPDNVEYGLSLARAQTRGGKGKEALATVESLRQLPAPTGNDARIEMAASEAWRSLGDFKQSETFAGRAAQKARAQNAKLLLARALYHRGFALENLGDTKGAVTAVEEAGRIYRTVGDRYSLASTQEVTGQVLVDRGDYPGALGEFNEELAIAREVGNRKAEGSALNNMAFVLSQQGDAEKARGMYEKALPIFREVTDKTNYAMTLVNIAGITKDGGDLAGAMKTYDQALALDREINDQNGIAVALAGIGTVMDGQGDSAGAKKTLEQAMAFDVALGQTSPSSDKLIDLGDALQHMGDLPGARKNYADALALARTASDKSMAAYALVGLGSLEVKAADFTAAQKDYEEALAFRNELGEKYTITTTQVAIAELATEEGHPGAAERPAREARDEFQQTHKGDDQITATAVLADALLAGGRSDDAFKEVTKMAPLGAKSQNLSVQLDFAVAHARSEAASGKIAAAKTILKDALAKAMRSGYVGYQLECRLALEEIELKSGKSAASRARLEQLQKDAKEKGFDLIARKAATLSE